MKKTLFSLSLILLSGCTSVPETLPVITKTEPVGRKETYLNAEYVLKTIGEPDLKRKEGASEVWVYPQDACVLFLYMDLDEAKQDTLVRHMEIGTPHFKATEKNSTACLKTAWELR